VLSPEWGDERARLAAMAQVSDPSTRRLLDDAGLTSGWRCLEVGAGAGSVASWMARRVVGRNPAGRSGHVTATDIDTRFLRELSDPNLTVLEHDVTADEFPQESFDLIHACFVLEHLPAREQVLDKMVRWLAPGGTLVLEAIAGFPVDSSPNPAFRQFFDLGYATIACRGRKPAA